MILENYVSSKIAELLREKGFDEICYACYEYFESSVTLYHGWTFEYKGRPVQNSSDRIKCPTCQMVLKWLREVYNLHIDIFIGIAEDDSYTYWTYFITDLKGNMIVNAYEEDIDFRGENYEQTIESAIENCLTNLI